MRAIGNYILVEEIIENEIKTKGGLLLNEKTREDLRYRKGKIVHLGHLITFLEEGEVVVFDKAAGTPTDVDEKLYLVITARDVVAVV